MKTATKSTTTAKSTSNRTGTTRLEKVFEIVGEKATAKKCDAMEGLIIHI